MFKASKDGMSSTGFSILTTPYLGPVKFKGLERKEIATTENCAVFVFECQGVDVQGNSVKGLDYQEVVWAPNDTDDDESNQKKADKMSYIISHLLDLPIDEAQEKTSQVEGANWTQYVDNMIALLIEHNATEVEGVSIKVPGNTYNKPKVKFPGYFAYIANQHTPPLTWSKGELDENSAYLQSQTAAPSDAEASPIADIDDADF